MAEQPIIIKKVQKGHAAHHGGSWKVAYADFMTAMMAFFMVMWLVGLSADVRNKIQGYFNDPLGFASTEQNSRTLLTMEGTPAPKPGQMKMSMDTAYMQESKDIASMEKKLEKALKADKTFASLLKGVQISQNTDGLIIEFAEIKGAVFFESGSAVIRPEALKLIHSIAPVLATAAHDIVVQGHTDSQPFGGMPTGNWGLSTERALSLQEALMNGGVTEPQFAEVSGYASRRPLDSVDPTHFSNRRVTILLPRRYKPGNQTAEPADSLKHAISSTNEPEAVVLKPDAPAINSK